MTDDKTRIGDKIPVFTAHALGTDTIHNHPSLDWSTIGEVAQHEFGMLLDYFMDKMNGGIWAKPILPTTLLMANTSTTVIRARTSTGLMGRAPPPGGA